MFYFISSVCLTGDKLAWYSFSLCSVFNGDVTGKRSKLIDFSSVCSIGMRLTRLVWLVVDCLVVFARLERISRPLITVNPRWFRRVFKKNQLRVGQLLPNHVWLGRTRVIEANILFIFLDLETPIIIGNYQKRNVTDKSNGSK